MTEEQESLFGGKDLVYSELHTSLTETNKAIQKELKKTMVYTEKAKVALEALQERRESKLEAIAIYESMFAKEEDEGAENDETKEVIPEEDPDDRDHPLD